MTHKRPIVSRDAIKPFADAGIIPGNCQRFVIDFDAKGVVRLHYTVLADERLFDVIPDLLLKLKEGYTEHNCPACGNPLDERFHNPITGSCQK